MRQLMDLCWFSVVLVSASRSLHHVTALHGACGGSWCHELSIARMVCCCMQSSNGGIGLCMHGLPRVAAA